MHKHKSLIYGSQAARHWFPDFPREPNDLDVIDSSTPCEALRGLLDTNEHEKYVDPDTLFTIKLSHSFWDIHWNKTLMDIDFFKSRCVVDWDLFDCLYKEWQVIHSSKAHIKLDKENEMFFQDAVSRDIHHDALHEMIAFPNRPRYKNIKNDQSKAACSRKLFDSLPHEEKILTCIEEAFVVACERWLIPYGWSISPKQAYIKALKALIVHMTKGWFPLFMVLNYRELRCYNNFSQIEYVRKNFKESVLENKSQGAPIS